MTKTDQQSRCEFVGKTDDGKPITVTLTWREWRALGEPEEFILRVRSRR